MSLPPSLIELKRRIEFVDSICAELAPIFAAYQQSAHGSAYRFEQNFALRDSIEGYFEAHRTGSAPGDQVALSIEIQPDGRIIFGRTMGLERRETELSFEPNEGVVQVASRIMGCVMDDVENTPGGSFRLFVLEAMNTPTLDYEIQIQNGLS